MRSIDRVRVRDNGRSASLRRTLICSFAPVIVAIAACATSKPPTLTDTASTRPVELQRNQELIVTLPSNPSTGYHWDMELTGFAVLDRIGDEQFVPTANSGGAVGAGGTTTWRFRAARTGTDLLRFAYRRPWEKDVPAAKSVVYTINVR